MPHVPQNVLDQRPLLEGLPVRSRGKVRDSYGLPRFPKKMLPKASNSTSGFDFVFQDIIEGKGEVLTATNHFWTPVLEKAGFKTDFVAAGPDIDRYLPLQHQGNAELQKTATVVRRYRAPYMEDVVRVFLLGNAWKEYKKNGNGKLWGHQLPLGLKEGHKFDKPIYTPTTKAKVGHDMPININIARRKCPGREEVALGAAQVMYDYAITRGIILADTKFELTLANGEWIFVDERGTPDSSRYWDAKQYQVANDNGKLPPSFDKQFLREWAKSVLIDRDEFGRERDPENPEDLAYVAAQRIPPDVIAKTIALYRELFQRLTGMSLEQYQRDVMKIAA